MRTAAPILKKSDSSRLFYFDFCPVVGRYSVLHTPDITALERTEVPILEQYSWVLLPDV